MGLNRVLMIVILVLAMMVIVGRCYADTIVNLGIISEIESNNRDDLCSYRGCKYGRGRNQVSEILLKEYNGMTKHEYMTSDLFDRSVNDEIASWYLSVRIPQMLRYYKKEVTLRNILIAYNAGISYVVKPRSIPQETTRYIEKYLTKEELYGLGNSDGASVDSRETYV